MTTRWGSGRAGGEPTGRSGLFQARTEGAPPMSRAARNARLAALPVAYAGRRAAGVGRRALGRSADEVDREIQLRTAQHIFEVLGELKGCATKLGQLLSIYQLALPEDIADPYRIALTRLQDAAPIMLPPAVDAAMAASMGGCWRAAFGEFDDHRAAAASIGQVHRAIWHDGRPVAVKIMYPGGRAAVEADLTQLRRISTLASVFLPGADVKAVTEAICDCVRDELDYGAEADNQRAFAAAFADDPDFYIPAVVRQRGDVLISEWLDGTPVSRIIASGSKSERDRVGMLMTRFVLSGWRHDLLYCDPHPGNFRLLPDGRLGIVDFGACAPWPSEFRALAYDFCDAFFTGGAAELEAGVRAHGFVDPGRALDADALVSALGECGEPLRHSTFRLTTRWLRKQVVRTTNPRLSNVVRELTMPAPFTPFARAGLTLIGALSQLEAEGSYLDEVVGALPFLDEVFQRADVVADARPIDLAAQRRIRAAQRVPIS
ncbi:ABC1 kinase family protein [Nocardia cyriacigeorgica]|uniref:ABC1 kinase family protein n=1 Tax=Nocardia cyriacigeorgica TaxID=135487 RepID=UPI002453F7B6|nr:AarF/UbiB family protein [Nocardia cyriacigeorgica]